MKGDLARILFPQRVSSSNIGTSDGDRQIL
jgi:hypothetical protein